MQINLKQYHKCHFPTFSSVFKYWRNKTFLQCQIFSRLNLIWPKSLEICFVWSSSYHSSPFLALRSPPCLACPVLHYLFHSNFRFSPWLTCRGASFERGCRAPVEHNSPSIPPSFHPSTAPSSPSLPPTWLKSDRGVCGLRAALRESLERLGTEQPREEWRWGQEANSLSVSNR